MASLGEAIALQGVDTGAQQLGQIAYQQGAQRKKDEATMRGQMSKYTKGFGNFHRMAQKKAAGLYESAMAKIADSKASGDPYWINEAQGIIQNLDMEMSNLKTISDNYKIFDKQIAKLDPNKVFIPKDLQNFLQNDYRQAKDYEELSKMAQEKGYDFGGALGFDVSGNILYNPEARVNYTQDMVKLAKEINPVIKDKVRFAGPDGKPIDREIYRIPFTEDEVNDLVDNNPEYATTRPKSIERVATEYIYNNPAGAKQFAIQNNIPLEYEQTQSGRTLSQKSMVAIKNGLMELAKGEAYQKPKDIKGRASFNISVGAGAKESALSASLKAPQQEFMYKEGTGQTTKEYNTQQFGNLSLEIDNLSLVGTNKVFDQRGNELKAGLQDVKLIGINNYPVRTIGNPKDKNYRIVYKGEEDKFESIKPMYVFMKGGNKYFVPASDKGLRNKLIGKVGDVEQLDEIIGQFNRLGANASKAITTKYKAGDPKFWEVLGEAYEKANY